MNNKLLYHRITPYRCKICNQDTLFFETAYGTVIDYKNFLNCAISREDMISKIERKEIRFLKCIQCQRSFLIDWTNGWPEQLLDASALKKF